MKTLLGLIICLTAAGPGYAGELETTAASASLNKIDFKVLRGIDLPAPAFPTILDVDLDKAYLAAVLHGRRPKAQNKNWDGAGGFPAIVNQDPIGACQSFAMTAMLEYIFYHETGQVIDLSEKYTAYSLLRFMTDKYWNESDGKYDQYPTLGSGTTPLMIASILKYGAIPSTDYPWGDLSNAAEPSSHLDIALLGKVFAAKPDREYTRTELLAKLDEAFLSPPPAKFIYNIKRLNYAAGKDEIVTLKNPLAVTEFLEIGKDRFNLIFNNDYRSFYFPKPAETVSAILDFLTQQAVQYEIPNERAASSVIFDRIIESLDRRMVVGLAMDVWLGDWGGTLVNKGGGGHAMVIVGYQKRKDDVYFKVRNSWGTAIGIGGYNYVSSSILGPNLIWAQIYK